MKLRQLVGLFLALAMIATACGSGSDGDSDSTATDTGSSDTADTSADADEPAAPAAGIDLDAIMGADLDNCAAAPSGDAIKVGMVMDFSEAAGFVDIPGSKLVPYVAELANCAGGINGQPVEVRVAEAGTDAALATQELIDWGAHFFVGPPFADATLPMQQTGDGQYAIFAAASTEPTLADADSNTFLVTFDDFGQSEASAEYALSQGLTRAIVFTEGEGVPYSGVNPDAFVAAFTAGGGEIVSTQTYAWFVDTDFSSQVNDIATVADGTEVVFSAAAAFQVTALRAQLEGQGLDGLTYMGTDAMDATGVQFETGGEGMIHTPHTIIAAGGANDMLFQQAIAAGVELDSLGFMPLYVDSMLLGIQGILDCGCTEPSGIAEAVKNISGFEGTSGTITYAGTNGIPDKAVPIAQVQGGENVLLTEIG
ncbi:ABC transporter substrate-binding protein [bacterium]|nr:ABC transporter substrate-binding protein [Acidimicrobiaceae bacterium]MCH9805023.1 ABC transporter substrate-binding protein [bacterium]MDC1389241.1 ABC transporter substrate-binding protein [Acidimicrobiales bacterium]